MNRTLPLVIALATLGGSACPAAITAFERWTVVEDPTHPGFEASATVGSALLSAGDTPIPAGTDIGFQSVTGATVASSRAGYSFDPGRDFALAIDYAWSFSAAPTGFLALGFGIGEDTDGTNSAGIMMATLDGSPFLGYLGTARVGDIDQPLVGVGSAPATLSGTFFLDYRADTGDVVLGAATTPGAAAPDVIGSFSGIQNQWDGDGLLASFFLRSDQPPLVSSWQGGQANVTLSNFRVRSGAATAIPEPGAALLGGLVSGGLALRRLPRRRTVRRSTGLARRRG